MLIHYLCDVPNEEVSHWTNSKTLNQTPIQVKACAVKATSSFILCHESEKSIVKHMSDCILPMLHVMSMCIDKESDDSPLKSFIELSEKCPQILRPQFEPLVELCLKTMANKENSDTYRHLALEILISLSENAASTVRKRGTPYLPTLGIHCFLKGFSNAVLINSVSVAFDDDWSGRRSWLVNQWFQWRGGWRFREVLIVFHSNYI